MAASGGATKAQIDSGKESDALITKLKELRDFVIDVCQVKEDKNVKGVYHTTDKDWFLVEKKLLESLLLTEQTYGIADTAYGKLVAERALEKQAKDSVKGCAVPISVLILTLKGYRKEETARILGVPLEEVEDVLYLTEDFDEDVRANLILKNSKNLFKKDVNDFLSCGGSYTKFRELLEKRAESIIGF